MKTLILVRHCAYNQSLTADMDKIGLSLSGRRHALKIGQTLAATGLIPDVAVTSGIARASETTGLILEGCGLPPQAAIADARLSLHPGDGDPLEAILKHAGNAGTVMAVSHSEILQGLLGWLGAKVPAKVINALPTHYGLVCFLSCPIDDWKDLAQRRNALFQTWWRNESNDVVITTHTADGFQPPAPAA